MQRKWRSSLLYGLHKSCIRLQCKITNCCYNNRIFLLNFYIICTPARKVGYWKISRIEHPTDVFWLLIWWCIAFEVLFLSHPLCPLFLDILRVFLEQGMLFLMMLPSLLYLILKLTSFSGQIQCYLSVNCFSG